MARQSVARFVFANIGTKLKKHRKAAHMTQRQMAKALGIPYSTYSNYENDYRIPDAETVNKICEILNISIVDLMGRFSGKIGFVNGEDMPDLPTPAIPFTPENILKAKIEGELVFAFRKLNDEGKKRAMEYIDTLLGNPKFAQESSTEDKLTAQHNE